MTQRYVARTIGDQGARRRAAARPVAQATGRGGRRLRALPEPARERRGQRLRRHPGPGCRGAQRRSRQPSSPPVATARRRGGTPAPSAARAARQICIGGMSRRASRRVPSPFLERYLRDRAQVAEGRRAARPARRRQDDDRRLFAARHGLPFLSVTREIEARAGMSLNDLFNLGGPDAYRTLENEVVAELCRAQRPDRARDRRRHRQQRLRRST